MVCSVCEVNLVGPLVRDILLLPPKKLIAFAAVGAAAGIAFNLALSCGVRYAHKVATKGEDIVLREMESHPRLFVSAFFRGAVEETRPTIFGETGVEEHLGGGKPQKERVVYGAGGYAVKVSADGFVDLSAADAAMREAQNRISALEAALRGAGVEIPFSPRGGRGGGYRGRGGRGGYHRGGEGDRQAPN